MAPGTGGLESRRTFRLTRGQGLVTKALVCLLLVALTLFGFWEVQGHDFLELWDDEPYITANARVKQGLSLANIAWACTTTEAANWHPLTWISHMLDVELFGLAPGPHHVVSLLWHLANTLLVFVLFSRIAGAVWRSAAVAALFALHPLHVESVAWVSERKDVLSTFFLLSTLLAYAAYVTARQRRWYAAALLCFALGLMAKPMLVSLPLVLLVLDFWPFARVRGRAEEVWRADRKGGDPSSGRSQALHGAGRLVWEKVPFLALAGASAVATLVAQKSGGALVLHESLPLSARVENALASYAGYVVKMLWPASLAVFYPFVGVPGWQVVAATSSLVACTGVALWARQRRPYLLVGWCWYLVTLLPVVGLVQVGGQAMADRYAYIPLTGLFVALVWGASDLARRWRYGRVSLALALALVLAACLVKTRTQVMTWRDSITLFTHAVRVTPRNSTVHYYLGMIRGKRGQYPEAIAHYDEALRIEPMFADAHNNLGIALSKAGDQPRALAAFLRAIQIRPTAAVYRKNLGLFYVRQGRSAEAGQEFARARQLDPKIVLPPVR